MSFNLNFYVQLLKTNGCYNNWLVIGVATSCSSRGSHQYPDQTLDSILANYNFIPRLSYGPTFKLFLPLILPFLHSLQWFQHFSPFILQGFIKQVHARCNIVPQLKRF